MSIMISKRAALEMSTKGIGVSTTARIYVRKVVPEAAGLPNRELNERIAANFLSGTPVYRFRLTKGPSKGIAEIRQVGNMYYIAFIRGRGSSGVGYDIIAIQQAYKKPSSPAIEKTRLTPGWGFEY